MSTVEGLPEVGDAKLDDLLDNLFRLDSASPDLFKKGGALRQVLRWGFASQVMYYEVRLRNKEARTVIHRMNDALQASGILRAGEDPVAVFTKWGKLIEAAFSVANLNLTEKTSSPDLPQV
jgi:hypothetical protein